MTARVVAIAALVGGAFAAASATLALSDSDVYWHLATARETAAHGLVRADVFSWAARGSPVATDQWLGDLLLYAGYAAAGWPGVIAVRTLVVALLTGAVAASALVRRPASPVAALAVAVPALVLSRVLWTERPELIGAACFALLVLFLQLPRERPLIGTVPLLLIWANVHGSFALGAVLVLLVGATGLARQGPLRRGYAIAMAGALASFVLTPAGVGTLSPPGIHLLSPPREIQEWAPPDPSTPAGAMWALVLGLTLATAILSGGARVRDIALIVPVALLSLMAIRHAPLFAIAATPFLAERVPAALTQLSARAAARSRGAGDPARRERTRPDRAAPRPSEEDGASAERDAATRGNVAAARAVAVAGVALLALGIAIAPREPDESAFPVGALASLPTGPGLLAEYDWGGWLIWRAPDTPVFIDGRLIPYRGPVLDDYRTIVEAAPPWRDVLARRGVRWILVRPSDPVAVRALELGWRTLSRSSSYVLISVADRSP